ncbi:MAG: MmcQ/YjbR family DNA-binding protein [Streptosporangiaceae bacterium]
MATVDDVRRIALSLPATAERDSRGNLDWRVADKSFVWERPLRKGDIAALGNRVPAGPVYAARTGDEGVKHALIADDPAVYFTTPHFDGYAAVLFELDRISVPELTELITDAWLARAPKKLAATFLAR